ncbi:MAG: tryptophan--tRNA ligase [Kofleriaceae bacterium]
MRIISGVQPTGQLHLGNYFGAIQPQLALQGQGELLLFVADLHALTTVHDRVRLVELTREVALAYLALGLDPDRATLFRQSEVPEVTELTWILATVAGMGLLERAHAYKDKRAHGLPASVGLFLYPVLMAADILLYGADVVPVGADQRQHLEMTRDLAHAFHTSFGEVFALPREHIDPRAAIVPGIDGRKMSKSYGNTIELFAEPRAIEARVKAIQTDSRALGEPLDPEANAIYPLYALVAAPDDARALAEGMHAGEIGYGEAKRRLAAAIDARFAAARARRGTLTARDADRVLAAGAIRARAIARETMIRVRDAVGLAR